MEVEGGFNKSFFMPFAQKQYGCVPSEEKSGKANVLTTYDLTFSLFD